MIFLYGEKLNRSSAQAVQATARTDIRCSGEERKERCRLFSG